MNESEHSDELFDFLYKTSNASATKIFESLVDQKPPRQFSLFSV